MRKHLQFQYCVSLGFCLLLSWLSHLFSGLQTEGTIFVPCFIRYYTMCWFYLSCHWNSKIAQLNFVACCCALHISTYTKDFLIEFSFLSSIFWEFLFTEAVEDRLVTAVFESCCMVKKKKRSISHGASLSSFMPDQLMLNSEMCTLVMAVSLLCNVHDYWNARANQIDCWEVITILLGCYECWLQHFS